MTVERFTGPRELAASLAARLIDAITRQPRVVLGLPTGRTSVALYRELVARSTRLGVDWSLVRTFNIDEFVGLAGGDAGSYRAFMQAELFDHVPLPADRIGMLDGRAPDLAGECERYERAIAAAGGIDILVLGIGANGHIGFNEPADGLHARTHVATLEPDTRAANAGLFGGDASRVPDRALSMGVGTILSARHVVLVATGLEKADAVAATVRGPVTTRVPASLLQVHPRVAVLVDLAAASRL